MDTTLAINPGSSSKKYALYKGSTEVLSVRFERTGEGYGKCVSVNGTQNRCETVPATAYEAGLSECLGVARREGVLEEDEDISCIGLRIVAPHRSLSVHRIIDESYEQTLLSLSDTAPLHIPSLIEELNTVKQVLPEVAVVGVSDSAFHTTLPEYATRYSISDPDANTCHVYRFGYHGLSVASVLRVFATLEGTLPPRTIVVHVGSGVSVTAVREGKSVDTTMGFGPASGVIMGTRGGDIDAVALLHIERTKGFSPLETAAYLNTKTGLMGMTGTSDLRIVFDRAKRGDANAKIARDMFFYQLKKAMHAYIGVLGGVDAIILTGTAAERNAMVRMHIVEGLAHLGCTLNHEVNESIMERAGKVSASDSVIAVHVIPTREMEEIARIAKEVTRSS